MEHVTIRFSEESLDFLINRFTKWAKEAHEGKIKRKKKGNDPDEIDMESYWCGKADAYQSIKNHIIKKKSEEPKMKELENQVAYVAHPYGGHEVNRELTTMELLKLSKGFPSLVLVSPLHNFEWVEYIADRHTQDLFQDKCNALLDRADILILTGAWMDSHGCMQEFERAKEQGKPIFIYKHGELSRYKDGEQYGGLEI